MSTLLPTVDNTAFAREYVRARLQGKGDFLPFIILRRSKDGGGGATSVLSRRNVYSVEDYDHYLPELRRCCESYGARLYMKVNKRTDESVAMAMHLYVTKKYTERNYHQFARAYDHCVGTTRCPGAGRRYLVDVDFCPDTVPALRQLDLTVIQALLRATLLAYGPRGEGEQVHTLPTRQGFHLVAPAFDCALFKKNVDAAKAGGTLFWDPSVTVMVDAEALILV